MGTILFVVVMLYAIFLNLRLKDIEESVESFSLDNSKLELKLYNKMMEIRSDLKKSINEKSRRKSTKKRGRVFKDAIPKSKILRKFRGDKNHLQAGGKG